MNNSDFYLETLEKLLAQGILNKDMKILVVCGDLRDKKTLFKAGFERVTISNINTQQDAKKYEPYEWCFQDCENLSYEDETFDFCIVHNGLHHCASPHRGLLELFRVCRKGILAFEPKYNPLINLATKLGFAQEYEVATVATSNFSSGGIRNTAIPNYVYRWTERDVIQTLNSYVPLGTNKFIFIHGLNLSRVFWHLEKLKTTQLELFARLSEPFISGLSKVFPWSNNMFAFIVLKGRIPEELHPWLKQNGDKIIVDREWVNALYTQSNSSKKNL